MLTNQLINGRYKVDNYLGFGGFSKVVKCFDTYSNITVALKMISDKTYDDRLEISIMKQISNSEDKRSKIAIQYFDSFQLNERHYVVLEYGGISLYDFMRQNNKIPFSLSFIRNVAKQSLEFLSFLHSIGIIHCDIKPENIMLKNEKYKEVTLSEATCAQMNHIDSRLKTRIPIQDDIKFIDFGLACYGTDKVHTKRIGTRPYYSPEMILERGWSYGVDIWSIGCTLLELYTGIQPFCADDDRDQLLKMELVLGKFPSVLSERSKLFSNAGFVNCPKPHFDVAVEPLHRLINHSQHPQFLDFIRQLLECDPNKRISCEDALKHPFINFVD